MSKYIPAGKHKNVTGTLIRNTKIGEHINYMFSKIKLSTVFKQKADPDSISSIKQRHGCHRLVARRLKENV